MADVAAYLTAVASVIGGSWNWRLWRRRGSPGAQTARYVAGAGYLLGLSALFGAPSLQAWLSGGPGSRPLGVLVYSVLIELFDCMLVGIAFSVAQPPRPMVRWLAGLPVVVSASILLFLLADVRTDADPSRVIAERGYGAAFNLVSVGYSTIGLARFALVMWPYAREQAPAPMRRGLQVFSIGICVGAVWTAWGLENVVEMLHLGGQDASEDDVAALLGLITVALCVAGLTLTGWAAGLAQLRSWWRLRASVRRLEPLRRDLQLAIPDVRLQRHRSMTPSGLQFARYRQVIEIRDAQLALRAHVPAELVEWLPAGSDPATVEAASLAAALVAHATGIRPLATPPGTATVRTPTPPETSVDAEAAWLAVVADAFARSEAVAAVRARMLAAPAIA